MPVSAFETGSLLSELKKDDWEASLMKGDENSGLKDPRATESLVRLIRNEGLDWRMQIRGIRILGSLHTDTALEALIGMFSDIFFHQGCPAVRSSLARALGNYRGARVADVLISGLDDPELPVREACIISLGDVGEATAVPYLIDRLKDRRFVIRISAIRALGRIGDMRAVPSLREIVENETDPLLKGEAAASLSLAEKGHASGRSLHETL